MSIFRQAKRLQKRMALKREDGPARPFGSGKRRREREELELAKQKKIKQVKRTTSSSNLIKEKKI